MRLSFPFKLLSLATADGVGRANIMVEFGIELLYYYYCFLLGLHVNVCLVVATVLNRLKFGIKIESTVALNETVSDCAQFIHFPKFQVKSPFGIAYEQNG